MHSEVVLGPDREMLQKFFNWTKSSQNWGKEHGVSTVMYSKSLNTAHEDLKVALRNETGVLIKRTT